MATRRNVAALSGHSTAEPFSVIRGTRATPSRRSRLASSGMASLIVCVSSIPTPSSVVDNYSSRDVPRQRWSCRNFARAIGSVERRQQFVMRRDVWLVGNE